MIWVQLDIAYDSFIRTTDPRHEALVSQVLERVWERGDIYKAQYRWEQLRSDGSMLLLPVATRLACLSWAGRTSSLGAADMVLAHP